MNSVNLVGNVTRDIDLAFTKGKGTAVVKFGLAVRRDKENTDFINCVAFAKTAELIANFFGKGSSIGISGRLQTGSYETKDGHRVYTTDVIVSDITFIDKKKQEEKPDYTNTPFNDTAEGTTQLEDGLSPF